MREMTKLKNIFLLKLLLKKKMVALTSNIRLKGRREKGKMQVSEI
jgi:hypothetical protein